MHYPVLANPGKPHQHAVIKDIYEKEDEGACGGTGREEAPQSTWNRK
jgi:hypothetical protein